MSLLALQQNARTARSDMARLALLDLTQHKGADPEHALVRQQSIVTLVGLGWTVEQIATASRLDLDYVISALAASLSASLVQLVARLNPDAPFTPKD